MKALYSLKRRLCLLKRYNYQTYQERYKHRRWKCRRSLICSSIWKWWIWYIRSKWWNLFLSLLCSIIPTVQRTHKARYIIPTQWLNNSTRCSYRCKHYILEIGSWTSSKGGATIYASQFSSILSNKFNWIEYRVRITRWADQQLLSGYWIIPVYGE